MLIPDIELLTKLGNLEFRILQIKGKKKRENMDFLSMYTKLAVAKEWK